MFREAGIKHSKEGRAELRRRVMGFWAIFWASERMVKFKGAGHLCSSGKARMNGNE